MNIAAAWCLQNNYELEQGLEWAKSATAANGFGDSASFPALTTKALLLEKLGRAEEAKMVMQNALPFGNMGQLNQYGRQLLAAKRNKEALEVFQLNHNKNPNQLVTLVGLARGLSAKGDYAAALEFAVKALPLAPNEQAAQAIQVMIDKLKAGRDIN
jgi:tetratricopeptide (TPR) repeat protein